MTVPDGKRELDGLRSLDPQVVGAIFDRFFPDIYRFVRFRLGDEAAAEDIASEVFVKLLEAVRVGRGPDVNVKAWLLGTASHLVSDHHRRSYRRPTETLTEDQAGTSDDPTTDVEGRERALGLKSALAALTEEQQTVINLRFNEAYSLEETAILMKKNVNAVKQLQFRALAALSREIGELP